MGFGIIFIILGVILLFAGLLQLLQNKSFKDAQVVTGVVIDKRKRDVKNGTAYELTIKYIINGIEYNKVVGVKLEEYRIISENDYFDLKYRTDKPHKAVNPDTLNPQKARTVLLFGAGMIVIGIVLLLFA